MKNPFRRSTDAPGSVSADTSTSTTVTPSSPAGETEEDYPAYRWVIVGLMWLTQQASTLAVMSLGLLLPAMREDLGFGPFVAGVVGASAYASQLFLGIPISLWIVQFRPKPVMVLLSVAGALFAFLQGAAFTVWVLIVARFFYAATNTPKQAAQVMLRVQWVPRRELGFVMGMGMGMSNISQGLALILTPALLVALGSWRNTLHVYGLIMFATAVLWLVLGREREVASPQAESTGTQDWSLVFRLLRRSDVRLLCSYWFFALLPFTALLLFYPTYLVEQRGLSLGTAGVIVAVTSLTGIGIAPIGGWLSDRIGLRRPLIWPFGILALFAQMALFLPVSAPWLGLIAFVYGVCLWIPPAVIMTVPYELEGMGPADVAITSSIAQTMGTAGSILAALGAGLLFQLTGSVTIPLFVSSFGWLTRTAVGLLLPETGPKADRHRAAAANSA